MLFSKVFDQFGIFGRHLERIGVGIENIVFDALFLIWGIEVGVGLFDISEHNPPAVGQNEGPEV